MIYVIEWLTKAPVYSWGNRIPYERWLIVSILPQRTECKLYDAANQHIYIKNLKFTRSYGRNWGIGPVSEADDELIFRKLACHFHPITISMHQLTLQPIVAAEVSPSVLVTFTVWRLNLSSLTRNTIIDLARLLHHTRRATHPHDLSQHINSLEMIRKSRHGARGFRKVSTGCLTCKWVGSRQQ